MSLTQNDCEKVLADMTPQSQAQFLARLGHRYTVCARDAYEFQGPGITKPGLLRDFNELHHRLYAQLSALATGSVGIFPPDVMAVWLCGEGKDAAFRAACMDAFESCLRNCSPR